MQGGAERLQELRVPLPWSRRTWGLQSFSLPGALLPQCALTLRACLSVSVCAGVSAYVRGLLWVLVYSLVGIRK